MSSSALATLLEKFVNDSATPDELQQLRNLLKDPQHRGYAEDWIEQLLKRRQSATYTDFDVQDMFLEVMKKSGNPAISPTLNPVANDPSIDSRVHQIHFLKTAWFRYAAAILFFVAIGSYLWFHSKQVSTGKDAYTQLPADIEPGKTGAVLTLADGSQLVLDSMSNGVIAAQNGAKVVLNSGQLTYDITGNSNDKMSYNTMSTPKGRQFHVTLPDGTVVWLNAASSITYPTVFNGKERRVKIRGELYFDVAKKSSQPFIVETDNQQVEVLGTAFNINAYADEKTVQTTLLTGTVKVIPILTTEHATIREYQNESKILIPGQTAILNKINEQAGSLTITATQNPDKMIAWKNGLFNFDDVDLYSVMRQLERWYNIEVQYEGKPDNIIFKGKIHRNTNLSNVLKMLEMMGINFELNNNTLFVR